MKGRFLALWSIAALAAAAAFVVHLALRFETVRLGYEVGKARETQRKLIEARRLWSLEAATLRQTDRVETVARGTLGMRSPDDSQVIRTGSDTRAAGRAQ